MVIKKNFKQTELGIISNDWTDGEFSDVIANFSSGATPFRQISEYYKGKIRWITSSELNYNIINDTNEKISEEAVKKTNLTLHPKGTFLMAITGLEAEGTRGKCAIIGSESTTNQSCMALYPGNELDVNYLFFFYMLYSEHLAFKYCQGTKQQSYTQKIIGKLPINLPPTKNEQKKITTLLLEICALIEKMDILIEKKKNIKQGTIQKLLTRKIRLKDFDEKWIYQKLGDITKDIRDGTHQTPTYVKNGIPFYSVENITNNNFTNTKYISKKEHQKLTKSFKIEKNDILMTRIGSIGDCKLIDWDVNASFYVSLSLLKLNNKIYPQFMYQYSKSSQFKKELEIRSLLWAVPKKINLENISDVPLYTPKYKDE